MRLGLLTGDRRWGRDLNEDEERCPGSGRHDGWLNWRGKVVCPICRTKLDPVE